MKVALIIPSYNIDDYYPEYQSKLFFTNNNLVPGIVHPLGLMYISSFLKQNNIDVNLYDGAFYKEKEMVNNILEYNPDVIGIQVTSPLWKKTKKLSKKIKDIEDIPIIIGGPHLECAGVDVIKKTEFIDFAARGDGEKIFLGLCDEIESDKNLFSTPGLAWKNDNKLVKNEPIPFFIKNLDDLPYPDREIIEAKRYCPSIGFYKKRPVTTMITSRGCNRGCEFCHANKEPYRERSIDDVIKELKKISDLGYNDVIIYDQDFGANKERAMDICDRIVEEGIDLYLGCNLRIDSFDTDLVAKMKEAGFWRIFYGIESGSEKTLASLNKNIDKEMIRKAVRETDNIGISAFGSFIIGVPHENANDIAETIAFSKELPLTFAKFTTYSPWPGSEVWEDHEKYGTLDKTPENMSMNKINFIPSDLDYETQYKLLRKAYREFYMRPEYILRRVKQIETVDDVLQDIKGFLAFIQA